MPKRITPAWSVQLEQIKSLTAESSEGVMLVDLEQRIRWANPAALALHGVVRLEALGETVDDYHANFKVRFMATQAADTAEAGDAGMSETAGNAVILEVTPLETADAPWTFRMRKVVMVDHAGAPTCIARLYRPADGHATPHAATQGKAGAPVNPRHESSDNGCAANSPAYSAELCALSPTPLHVLDASMCVVDVSQAWLDWLDYPRETVVGKPITEFMNASSAEHFRTHSWKVFSNGMPVPNMTFDFVARCGATAEAVVHSSVIQDEDGAPEFVVAAPADTTGRRRSEASFSAAFNLSPVPMLVRTLDDARILDANEAFLDLAGYGSSAVVGRNVDDFGLFETRLKRSQFESALRSAETVQNLDARLTNADAEILSCRLSARRIHAFGKAAVLMVLEDVSDRSRDEAQLFEAIEMVMKDTGWFSRKVIEKLALVRSPPKAGAKVAEIGDMTPREREVLGLINQGLSDLEIAVKLGLTRSTVRNHVATLYSKIGVHSRSSAIIWARERGIHIEAKSEKPHKPKLPAPTAHRAVARFARDSDKQPRIT